ncbi:MAG: bifunctional phosphopantothenoylcysteine decarboxylase/phosphopantothenate--cysteine ligase CoaBC [Albidovulum sp.]|nr:bifunctional phosphopantothenoylcysteine decarboxylase/phosphopantothenate--cysteine ligase CoaBC [Albidovulum sp.]
MPAGKKVLLVIGGGIAAYKCLELIRRLRDSGVSVSAVMTDAAKEFVTPLSVSALAGEEARSSLFEHVAEAKIGHIELSRSADIVVVAPATADLMAKMAGGHADDLASTLLLATDKPVLLAPAMNVRMWEHASTRRNFSLLLEDGIRFVGPDEGDMACGEFGPGRMAEPEDILSHIFRLFEKRSLEGRHAIVTSGSTWESIDPIRYIANRSSGRQGTAIAEALAALGAKVSFVSGPSAVELPKRATAIPVETALEMREAVLAALPADLAIFAAAVADWRVRSPSTEKIKKGSRTAPCLEFEENPDILAEVAGLAKGRPLLVIGFAAETDNLIPNAASKRARKGCDWILANDVGTGTRVMGGTQNEITLISACETERWPRMSKTGVADKLASKIASHFEKLNASEF